MRLFDLFQPSPSRSTANAAKERLQLLLAIERSGGAGPNFLPQLQKDILEVINYRRAMAAAVEELKGIHPVGAAFR